MTSKADYVRGQGKAAGDHHCHWPGCERKCPPAMWGCKDHWFKLPKALRDRIWATYRPGQEISKDPSDAYMLAAREVREWILRNHPETRLSQENIIEKLTGNS